MTSDQLCLIAIGANIPSPAGGPARTLRAAMQHLDGGRVRIEAMSRFYRTPAYPPGDGPDFINAAAILRMPGPPEPEDVLARLHQIEAAFGRARTKRWGQRTLDMDLIAMGDMVQPDAATVRKWQRLDEAAQRRQAPDRLILPHPRVQDRAFVLVPLAEIAPDWRHPVLGQSVREMLEALPQGEVESVVAT